jgi:F0F1-type ATP synthase assembly protein I
MSDSQHTSPRNRAQNFRLAAIGIEFFSTILGLLVAGYLLDTYLHTSPWLGAAGIVLGLVLGIYRLATGLRHLDR